MSIYSVLRRVLPPRARLAVRDGVVEVLKRFNVDLSFALLPRAEQILADEVPHQLSVTAMRELIEAEEASSAPDAAAKLTARVMEMLQADPSWGRLLDTQVARAELGAHELYNQAVAARHFGRGEVARARQTLQALVAQFPSAFNVSCLARTLAKSGDEIEAARALQSGLAQFPHDPVLQMELATLRFKQRRTDEANRLLAPVRPFLVGIQEPVEPLTRELEVALGEQRMHRSAGSDRYDEAFTRAAWWAYWQSFHTFSEYQHPNGWLNQLIQSTVGGVLESAPEVTRVIDFGVLCAHPNYELARRFPQVEFVGVDRPEYVRELNEAAYRSSNLSFVAGDMLELLPALADRSGRTLLFHSRTACLCYPAYLRALYERCRALGVSHIAMYESLSLSQDHLTFFDYGDLPRDAIANRRIMFIHNYPKVLGGAGYEVITEDRVASNFLVVQKDDLGAINSVIVARAS